MDAKAVNPLMILIRSAISGEPITDEEKMLYNSINI